MQGRMRRSIIWIMWSFLSAKAEEVLPREYEKHGIYADVIVVDPPRKGCDGTLLDTIVAWRRNELSMSAVIRQRLRGT